MEEWHREKAVWEMPGSQNSTQGHGGQHILVLPGWTGVRLLLVSPGPQSLVPRPIPGEGGKEGRKQLLQLRASSSALAGLCFPPLIELEGSN